MPAKTHIKAATRQLVLTSTLLAALIFVFPNAQSQTLTTVYSFKGVPDGQWPTSAVVIDAAGNLYGTTYNGGNSSACQPSPYGCGTIYKIDPAGNETILHDFSKTDGRDVFSGIIMDAAENFCGTTDGGGTFDDGTLYKFDSNHVLTVLVNFESNTIGATPSGGLVRDFAGNLYGTVAFGGPSNAGGVFKWETQGQLRFLHWFTGDPDGHAPEAALIRDNAAHLYGTTSLGGVANAGTVFRLDKNGLTILHSFTAGPDADPFPSLVRDTQGNLYGITEGTYSVLTCVEHGGCGTVFKLDAAGNETILHTFSGGADGSVPEAGLLRDFSGNLYGTTTRGGDFDRGTIFRISASGKFKVLHSFTGGSEGANPSAPLVRDAAGRLYGTTFGGGAHNKGTVFRLDP